MSAGAPEPSIDPTGLGEVAAGYLAAVDHQALAARVMVRAASSYPDVLAELEAGGLPAAQIARVIALSSILTTTTIVADVLEAAELATLLAAPAAERPTGSLGAMPGDPPTSST